MTQTASATSSILVGRCYETNDFNPLPGGRRFRRSADHASASKRGPVARGAKYRGSPARRLPPTPRNIRDSISLAAAFVRRAQETSDASFYSSAEDAIKKSLQLAPDNFETEKIRVSILLGEHDFQTALDAAQKLNQAGARRRNGVWFADRCQRGTRELQGCRGRGTVDAQPSSRQSSGADSGRETARTLWRCRGLP